MGVYTNWPATEFNALWRCSIITSGIEGTLPWAGQSWTGQPHNTQPGHAHCLEGRSAACASYKGSQRLRNGIICHRDRS